MLFWRRKASEFGGLPPPTAFDLSRMVGGAWSHRFVIRADAATDELSLLIYGSKFAELLELPEEPLSGAPISRQLPGRYLSLFTRGCRAAISRAAPVRLSGVVVDYNQIELYRAAFMPLAKGENSPMQLVFGTFNRRNGPQAHSSDAVRAMYNSLIKHIRPRLQQQLPWLDTKPLRRRTSCVASIGMSSERRTSTGRLRPIGPARAIEVSPQRHRDHRGSCEYDLDYRLCKSAQ